MALKFNPFEKGKAAPTPQVKKMRRHYRVFDDPTRPVEDTNDRKEEMQNGSQTGYKETTNGGQTDHKEITSRQINGPQTGYKRTTRISKRATQQTTERITSRSQTDHKQTTNCDISTLVGHEQNLLSFIFDECRKSGELTTPPITLSKIKERLKTKASSTSKTIIARLIEKNLIQRSRSKTGRGGWMTFRVERDVFQRLLLETDYKQTTNGSQTDYKETTKQATQRTTSASSSSSNLDLNRTTTTSDHQKILGDEEDLPLGWEAIDVTTLFKIKFGRAHLLQLANQNHLTPDEVQDSIYAFAFDLEVNRKSREINGSALNFFMGILRKGPYTPAANYEPPRIRQRRLYLEAKERERKTSEELESRIEAIEFDEWVASLSTEERVRFVPPTDFAKPGSPGHNVQLKQYFRENVWPERRENISKSQT